MVLVDCVLGVDSQVADDVTVEVPNGPVIPDGDPAPVEQGVMVGTQTQHVPRGIRSVVRFAQGSDVSTFGHASTRNIEFDTADLTLRVVEILDGLGNTPISDLTVDRSESATDGTVLVSRKRTGT